jgi:transcriptional regulator with XRE-family HTH domain
MTQMRLEGRSGVDQSLISRLELARAPHASLERIIRLGQALGDNFPLGYCPHEHRCPYRLDWQPPPWEGHLPYQRPPAHDQVEGATPDLEIVTDLDLFITDEDAADVGFGIDVSLSDIRADAWKGSHLTPTAPPTARRAPA